MKITLAKVSPRTAKISELKPGDCFIFTESCYLLLEGDCAVRLDGAFRLVPGLDRSLTVELLDSEIILKRS